jgi:hypothetical protein
MPPPFNFQLHSLPAPFPDGCLPNVVVHDFVNAQTRKQIIELNRRYGDRAPLGSRMAKEGASSMLQPSLLLLSNCLPATAVSS